MKKKLLVILLTVLMLFSSVSPAMVSADPLETDGNDIRVMGWNLLNTPGVINN